MRPSTGAVVMAGLGLFFLMGAARADIFHCVDRDGRSVFRDTPCPKGMRTSGVTTYVPSEQPAPEPQGPAPEELAALLRIQQLELEVAQLRASLQAAQAAPPAPVEEVVQEPVYVPGAAIIVVPNRPPHHRGDGPHHHGVQRPMRNG